MTDVCASTLLDSAAAAEVELGTVAGAVVQGVGYRVVVEVDHRWCGCALTGGGYPCSRGFSADGRCPGAWCRVVSLKRTCPPSAEDAHPCRCCR